MSIFLPIIQEDFLATFTKILDKEDSLVNPKTQNATEIWNHFRAFISFPSTSLSDDFWGRIKISDCLINPEFATLVDLENWENLGKSENFEKTQNFEKTENEFENKAKNKNLLTKKNENITEISTQTLTELSKNNSKSSQIKIKNHWRQVKIGKENLTFLVCQNQTLLQVKAIKTPNGQKIDFCGFQF